MKGNLKHVTKTDPCPHCGKTDWCYSIGELSVCKRLAPPTDGWKETSKADSEGTPYYAPIQEVEEKPIRPAQTRSWVYTNTDGNPYLKACRVDYGDGRKKKIWQEHFKEGKWLRGYGETDLSQGCLYQFASLNLAIAEGKRIFIVEGEPKADLLISMGLFATCNIGGSSGWKSHYKDQLQGAKIVLVPDRDKIGVNYCKKIEKAISGTAKSIEWLYPKPDSPFWAWEKLPPSNGLDVFDWIEQDKATIEDLLAAIQPEQRSDHCPKVKTTQPLRDPLKITYYNDGDISKKLQDWELREFFEELGDRVQFDDLKSRILIDGEPFAVEDDIKFWFLEKFKLRASKQDIKDGLLWAAKRQTFNPIEKYLKHCAENATPCDIDNVATRYFGRSEPIFNRMVKMWLISAVARALDPGCQADHTLILQSSQGKYKSTWFKILGGDWFSDSLKDIDNKDSLLMLHSNWILEFSELDRVTNKKQAGTIKHFLTQRTDHFRKPYGYEIQENNRRNVFCGTVNPSKFLVDDENRRFWVIPVADSIEAIDIDLIKRERDGIWAAAYAAYCQGERWWPSEIEKATIALLTQGFKETDDWEQPIFEYIHDKEAVSSYDVLTEGLGLQEKDISIRESRRVIRILDSFGWTKETRKKIDGKFRRVRLNPNSSGNSGNSGKSLTESEFEFYHFPDPNLVKAVISDQPLPDNQIPVPDNGSPETQTGQGFTAFTTKNHHFSQSEKNKQKSPPPPIPQKEPTDDIHTGDKVHYLDNDEIVYTVVSIKRSNGETLICEWGNRENVYTVHQSQLTLIRWNGGQNGKN